MTLSKEQLFIYVLQNLNISTQVVKRKNFFKAGAFKYYFNKNQIVRTVTEHEFNGIDYDKKTKNVVYEIIRTMGVIKVNIKQSGQSLMKFSHKSEPIVLV